MARLTLLRENSHLPREGWSHWIWAMAPSNTIRKGTSPRGQGEGKMNPRILGDLNKVNPRVRIRNLCGVYEWRATMAFGRVPRVVYVGSTRNLQNRIYEYCEKGNHKSALIDDALRRGYELWVRFKPFENEEQARRMENDLLAKYNYAWNVRRNHALRSILP